MAADVTDSTALFSNVTSSGADVTTELYELPSHHPGMVAVYVLLYVVIFVLGSMGNSLVVYIVAANKNMQSITNTFILNLAFSDILLCLFAVPFTPLAYFLPSWPFGEAVCRLVPMTLGVAVFVSTLTSVVIAIDR